MPSVFERVLVGAEALAADQDKYFPHRQLAKDRVIPFIKK
jgi:hypothetical protein